MQQRPPLKKTANPRLRKVTITTQNQNLNNESSHQELEEENNPQSMVKENVVSPPMQAPLPNLQKRSVQGRRKGARDNGPRANLLALGRNFQKISSTTQPSMSGESMSQQQPPAYQQQSFDEIILATNTVVDHNQC